MSMTGYQFQALGKALCNHYGLSLNKWSMDSCRVSKNCYWARLWGPNGKTFTVHGWITDVLPAYKPAVLRAQGGTA